MAFVGRSLSSVKSKPALVKSLMAVGNKGCLDGIQRAQPGKSTEAAEIDNRVKRLNVGVTGFPTELLSLSNLSIGNRSSTEGGKNGRLVNHFPSLNYGRTLDLILPQRKESNSVVMDETKSAPVLEKTDPSKSVVPVTDPRQTVEYSLSSSRLIVIRRKKMNKHKLKKLRRRMYYEFLKIRMRREAKIEKAFQTELLSQIADAEAFNAEIWAKDILTRSQSSQILKEEEAFYRTPEGQLLQYKLKWQEKLTPPPEFEEKYKS